MASIYVATWLLIAILVPMPDKFIAVGSLFLVTVVGIFIHKFGTTQTPPDKVGPTAR